MQVKNCISSSDHGPCVLCAQLPCHCIFAAAIHDDGTHMAAALEEDVTGDDGCSMESVECETCCHGGGVR